MFNIENLKGRLVGVVLRSVFQELGNLKGWGYNVLSIFLQ
jgi:hypothetical protein